MIAFAVACWFLAHFVAGENSGDGSWRPHILFVVMDDLGSADLGYHGHSGIETPTADALAMDGLRMINFYTLPTCTMTRVALLTGRYPYRMSMYEVLRYSTSMGIPLEEETVANVLRNAGYQTHAVGKWHVGHALWEYTPTFRGFQSFFGFHSAGSQDNYEHTLRGTYEMWRAQGERCGEGCSEYVQATGEYSSFLYANETIKLVKNYDESAGPMFTYLAFQAIHTPHQAPKSYMKRYQDSDKSDKEVTYAAYLTAADEALQTVIDAFKDKGLWKDTLIIYQTDNGAIRTGSNFPSRGGKKDVWEGGVLGEGFLGGPALDKLNIRRGVHKPIFHTLDWLPTLASITGATRKGNLPLDGRDQWDPLKTGKESSRVLFLGYSATDETSGRLADVDNYAAVRFKKWKLVRSRDKKDYELFNLLHDPSETKDVSGEKKKIVSFLKKALRRFEQKFSGTSILEYANCPARPVPGQTPWGQSSWQPWCDGDGNALFTRALYSGKRKRFRYHRRL